MTVANHAYPRPQLQRDDWLSLSGPWDFALDHHAHWTVPDQVAWNATITVPFSPETAASGIEDTSFYHVCWYRRSFDAPALPAGERLILHFGAVDYRATVWVNGHYVGEHEGGYTPFEFDITAFLAPSGSQTVVLRAEDDPHDLEKPRGKQDWLLEPHGIWYPRTTGVWQTVWLERVPATSISYIRWTPSITEWAIGLEVRFHGALPNGLCLRAKLHVGDMLLADDTYAVVGGEIDRRIVLSDPGIDDYRNELLWSPSFPTLIQAHLWLLNEHGETIDTVKSYTALREISLEGDRFLLNGRPLKLRLVLDQGYWLETGLTAPDDNALRRDVEVAKAMGFNGVRKHQKIEDPRFLYWADALGLLVWEEMPSAYRFTRTAVERLTQEWTAAIRRDASHPCIVTWVPFNESWGVPDLPARAEPRHYVQALYHLTKTLDPTRPVIGNDGWESTATDIVGVHDYSEEPERLAQRYHSEADLGRLFERERVGGRSLTIRGHPYMGQPIMLTEFGGIAFSEDRDATWGYIVSHDPETLASRYSELLDVVHSLKLFAGFCYTQFTDTYQEANGLLYIDRTPKFPLDEMFQATRGPVSHQQQHREHERRKRMQKFYNEYHVPDPGELASVPPLLEKEH